MNDAQQAWMDQVDAQTAQRVERAERDLDELTRRWFALAGMVPAGGAKDGVGVRMTPGPTVPIRVDVVDLQMEIAAWVREVLPLARGALRAGFSNERSTVVALGYLRSNIGSIWGEDPATAEDIARGAGRLQWRARRVAGEVSAAFPVDVDCPECGCLSLWAHPGRGLIRCGVSDCGGEWAAGQLAIAVWKSDTPTSHS